jgi:hypothetical protein
LLEFTVVPSCEVGEALLSKLRVNSQDPAFEPPPQRWFLFAIAGYKLPAQCAMYAELCVSMQLGNVPAAAINYRYPPKSVFFLQQ